MDNIEVEARSFISKEQYEQLLYFFKQKAQFLKEDHQETFYFDGEQDVRIQRNDFFSKIWLKTGKIHDHHREELEIKFDKSDFEKLERLFLLLGFKVKVKWFRKRVEFRWGEITVCLDSTKGYGYIIELEKMTAEENQEKEYEHLKQKLRTLNVEITPAEEFDTKFKYYTENWKVLIQES